MKILICGKAFPKALELLKALLLDEDVFNCAAEQVVRLGVKVDVLIPMMHRLEPELIEGTAAKLIHQWGVGLEGVDIAVCPPSCYLEAVGKALTGSKVGLGAQNAAGEIGLFGEFQNRQPTNRAWADPFDDSGNGLTDSVNAQGKVVVKRNAVPQPNQHWGDGLEKDALTFANFRMPLNDRGTAELYSFGGYAHRDGSGNAYRRYTGSVRNWPELYPLGFLPTFSGKAIDDLHRRFGFKRLVFVGDRGMVTNDNLEAITADKHGYLVGLKRRRNAKLTKWLAALDDSKWITCPVGITAREKTNPPRTRAQEIPIPGERNLHGFHERDFCICGDL